MRIKVSDLEAGIKRLNTIAKTPLTPYTKLHDGTFTPNARCYHLSGAYGGYMVVQMSNKPGCTSVSTPITRGHVSKRECYDTLHAYITGMSDAPC